MAYENSSGLNVHNQYGPRSTGGEQGVFKTEGFRNEYVIDGASQGLEYLFPRGGGVFVNGHDLTYALGTVTAITVGGLSVFGATETAPVHIPATNTGEVVVTGQTGGKVVVYFKKVAGYEEDVLPAFPGGLSMSDWYDAAKKHFNTVTGEAHAAFADAARAFYDAGGDLGGGSAVTPQAAPTAATSTYAASDFNGLVTKLIAAGVLHS